MVPFYPNRRACAEVSGEHTAPGNELHHQRKKKRNGKRKHHKRKVWQGIPQSILFKRNTAQNATKGKRAILRKGKATEREAKPQRIPTRILFKRDEKETAGAEKNHSPHHSPGSNSHIMHGPHKSTRTHGAQTTQKRIKHTKKRAESGIKFSPNGQF